MKNLLKHIEQKINYRYYNTLLLVLVSCQNTNSVFTSINSLPKTLFETSGIETMSNSDDFWTINDSSNLNELILINQKGEINQKIVVKNALNIDWESLASNGKDRLYIGDFGNNKNSRKDLAIYSVSVSKEQKDTLQATKTTFSYEDQKKFPPKKTQLNFDSEAFIYYDGYFYVFTKNRSSNFDGTTKLYKIRAKEGTQKALLIGNFKTCSKINNCQITGADISEDGKQLALLTHNKIFIFSDYPKDHFFEGTLRVTHLKHHSQKEAICFKGGDIYITDEKTKKSGGNIYRLKTK